MLPVHDPQDVRLREQHLETRRFAERRRNDRAPDVGAIAVDAPQVGYDRLKGEIRLDPKSVLNCDEVGWNSVIHLLATTDRGSDKPAENVDRKLLCVSHVQLPLRHWLTILSALVRDI